MPRSWSRAQRDCKKHPAGLKTPSGGRRECSCDGPGWRYRMGLLDPITGRRSTPRWSPTFRTRAEADAHQREARAREALGLTAAPSVTMGQVLDGFIADFRKLVETGSRKQSTLENYENVAIYLSETIGHVPISQMSTPRCRQVIDAGARTGGRRHLVKVVMSHAFKWAILMGYIERNAANPVKLFASKPSKPIAVDGDDFARLIAVVRATDDQLARMIQVDRVLGQRRGELLGQRWPDIDLERRLLHITHTIEEVRVVGPCSVCHGIHTRAKFNGTPKSAAGIRVLPLPPGVMAILDEQRAFQDAQRDLLGPAYIDHQLVWARPDGTPLAPNAVTDKIRHLLTKAGIERPDGRRPTLRSMRSSSATAMLKAGLSLEDIADMLGHSSTGVTRVHYLTAEAKSERAVEAARGPLESVARGVGVVTEEVTAAAAARRSRIRMAASSRANAHREPRRSRSH